MVHRFIVKFKLDNAYKSALEMQEMRELSDRVNNILWDQFDTAEITCN